MCSWSLNSNDFSHAFQTATECRVACILATGSLDRWRYPWKSENSMIHDGICEAYKTHPKIESFWFYICFLDFDDHYISLYDPPWDFWGLKNHPRIMGLYDHSILLSMGKIQKSCRFSAASSWWRPPFWVSGGSSVAGRPRRRCTPRWAAQRPRQCRGENHRRGFVGTRAGASE